jgi:hypothetical protein
MLTGFGNSAGTGKLTITAANTNGINAVGQVVNLSPEELLLRQCLDPLRCRQRLAEERFGDERQQREHRGRRRAALAAGLNLVTNKSASATTGLLGLTGKVVGTSVELYATNFTIGDTDPTFLYGISDVLGNTVTPHRRTVYPARSSLGRYLQRGCIRAHFHRSPAGKLAVVGGPASRWFCSWERARAGI